jgi:hypothetical protein
MGKGAELEKMICIATGVDTLKYVRKSSKSTENNIYSTQTFSKI